MLGTAQVRLFALNFKWHYLQTQLLPSSGLHPLTLGARSGSWQ